MTILSRKILVWLLVVGSLTGVVVQVQARIPGMIYTESGYDNIDGSDAICWSAPSYHNHSAVEEHEEEHHEEEHHEHEEEQEFIIETFSGKNWNSQLLPEFVAGPTTMLSSCPNGTEIHADILREQVAGSFRMRTHRLYTFHVTGKIDLEEIRKQYELSENAFFHSANGLKEVGMRIKFCPVSGLCSPFLEGEEVDGSVHDEGHDHDSHDEDHDRDSHDEEEHSEEDHEGHEEEDHDETHDSGRFRRALLNDKEHESDEGGNASDEEHESHHSHDVHGSSDDVVTSTRRSPLFRIPVEDVNETVFEFHVDVDIEIETPGEYIPLATMQFFLTNDTIHGHAAGIDSDASFKFDVANLLHQRAVSYYKMPDIRSVQTSVKILSYFVLGVAGAVQLALIVSTIHYRNEAVMTLSQGGFLIVLQAAGFVATVCSFLYAPESDAYCFLQSPMTLIPLQVMLAIVVGRLVRTLRVMEPLMSWDSPQNSRNVRAGLKTWRHTFMIGQSSGTSRSSSGDMNGTSSNSEESNIIDRGNHRTRRFSWSPIRTPKLRQKFTAGHLWVLVFLLTLPVAVLEIIGLTVFTPNLTLHMNDEESIGRFECGSNEDQLFRLASIGVIFITIFLALVQAQRSRRLPAFFNEAETVSFALVSSFFVASLGIAVVLVSQDPTAYPDVPYIVQVFVVVYIASILSVRLVLPKLRLIWRGEKVIISRILDDHRRAVRQSLSYEQPDTPQGRVSEASESTCPLPKKTREGRTVSFDENSIKVTSDVSRVSDAEVLDDRPHRPVLTVVDGESPPSKLTTRVVSHTTVMTRLNTRMLSGFQIDREEWNDAKASLEELHGLLEIVQFVAREPERNGHSVRYEEHP